MVCWITGSRSARGHRSSSPLGQDGHDVRMALAAPAGQHGDPRGGRGTALRGRRGSMFPLGVPGDRAVPAVQRPDRGLSLIHISEPTRLGMISYAVFCLKKKKKKTK